MKINTRLILAVIGCLATAVPALAPQTVFLVRHAERADTAPGGKPTMAADPDLSEAGRVRAASLADMLEDANVTAIFTTKYKRTQQTAAPLAKVLGIRPTVLDSNDAAALLQAIAATKGNVLVVGHSNTVPAIIEGLGITSPVAIADDEYDHLFVLTRAPTPGLLRLHYR